MNGSGFTGVTSVKFGTVPVASFMLVSGSQITTTAPAGTGSVAVTVTSPLGTSNGVTYTYSAGPVITGLNPASGPTSGGNTVTISGSGFTGTLSVHFGTASASFVVLSDSQVQVTAPAGSGAVLVTVTTSVGTSNGVTYTYSAGPVITGLNPASGPTSGGNTVTISG
ncbi:IPT/TIG domain-containing protein, partial [Kitasatospora sp. GP30]|uniref:IPT/TIG domain-containing protein n=1 Tax=Kitasatospora sp. GP30 TaxID=3035084 RepID=UPI002472F720